MLQLLHLFDGDWMLYTHNVPIIITLTGFISGGPGGAFAPPRNWLFRPFNMGLSLLGFVFAPPPPPPEFWNLAFAPSEAKS